MSNFDQQVAVEDFLFHVAHVRAQLLPKLMSTTLIGNWQTDFVTDHCAQGKYWLYYNRDSLDSRGDTFLKNWTREKWRSDIFIWTLKGKPCLSVSLCVYTVCRVFVFVCVWSRVLLGSLTTDKRRRPNTGWIAGVLVLLCISRWPLKVVLCHNTLAPTTPAAGKCHRQLLSAS